MKKLDEASYAGNIGLMELIKFHKVANDEQKKQLHNHIQKKNNKGAWELVQAVTKTKLHKSVMESNNTNNPDILPKSGAGQDGTDELVKTYIKDTPGQSLKSFKEYSKKK